MADSKLPTAPLAAAWCDAGGQLLGWGSTEKIGAFIPCPVCEKSVKVTAFFGHYGFPSFPRHKRTVQNHD
jgi:hypothetical protein